VNEKQLWALVVYTVFASTVIHGMAKYLFIDRLLKNDSH
jgi:hypothetical protein